MTTTDPTIQQCLCVHPTEERYVHDFGPNGYLGVPTGRREMCAGCGADFGPAAPLAVLDGGNELDRYLANRARAKAVK